MTARLTLTAAGAAAIADGANIGLSGVTFTRLATGAGTGTGDQSARTALEDERDIVAVTGAASTPARIALRADYSPSETYAVTEIGLFARVGAAGEEFLAAYWIGASATDAAAAAAPNTALVIAGVIEVASAAADVTVTPAVNIAVGVPANVVYQTQHATEDQRGIIELATRLEGIALTDRERAITAYVLGEVLKSYAALSDATFTRARGPTRASGDSGTDFATTEFVADALTSRSLRPVELYYNAAGLNLATGASGTSVTLSEGLSGFRYIECLFRQTSPSVPPTGKIGRAGIRASVRVIVADIPTARTIAYQLLVSDNSAIRAWRTSDTTLVLDGGTPTDALHAVIGYTA